jgi:hypothetical protein
MSKGVAMPTGRGELNPRGLMEAARGSLETQSRLESEVRALGSQLAESEEFASRFDEAVMNEDRETVLRLVREAGVSEEAEVTIQELDPDRRIRIEICILSWCIRCSCEW